MLKVYQGYHPIQMFWVMLTAILLWLPAFLMPDLFPQQISFVTAPALPLLEPLSRLTALSATLLAFFFWGITGYLLVSLNNRYLFLRTRSLLPLFFFLTLTTPVTGLGEINNFTLTLPLFLGVLHLTFRTYRNNKVDFSYFTAAFWVGMATLISLKSISYMGIIWLTLLSLRPFYPREWMVSLVGFFTPWLFFFGIGYLLDYDPGMLLRNALAGFDALWTMPSLPLTNLIFLGYIAILTLLASLFISFSLTAMKTRSRKFHIIFFSTAVLALLLMLRYRGAWLSFFPFLAIPLSFLLAFYFATGRASLYKRILFDLYLAGLVTLIVAGVAG